MEAIVYKSLKKIEPDLWDSIVQPDHIICSYAHLRALEESHINDCEYRFILFFHNKVLSAHACIYAISFDLDIFNRGLIKKIISFIRKYIHSEFLKMKVIECGTPTALGRAISFAKDTNRKLVMDLLIKEMEEYAREKKYPVVLLRDFYEEEILFFDRLILKGFKRIPNLPNALFFNNWSSFDEYTRDLRCHYRCRLKKIMKKLEDNSIRVEIKRSFSEYSPQMLKLWRNVYNHAKEYQREILTEEYFQNMDVYLKEKSCAILFLKEEEVIGFIFALIDDFTFRPLFVGMNYSFIRPYKLYFNILCYEILCGINQKKRAVEMGLTTTFPKRILGAHIFPLYGYMKHLSPLLNAIFANLFILMSPEQKEKPVHVYNRRYFMRICTHFKIKILFGGKVFDAHLHDLSEKGAQIYTKKRLKRNRQVLIELNFPNTCNAFVIRGRIVWIKRNIAGIQFISNPPDILKNFKDLFLVYKDSL